MVKFITQYNRILFKLKLFRELSSLSQIELAQKLSISLRTYQRIESGESILDLITCLKIIQVLEIDMHNWLSQQKPELNWNQRIISNRNELQLSEAENEIVEYFLSINSLEEMHLFTMNLHFQNSPSCFFLSINTKKISNATARSFIKIDKITKITFGYKDPNIIINYLDFLFTERPLLTKIDPLTFQDDLLTKQLSSINFHNYIDDNIIILSLINHKG